MTRTFLAAAILGMVIAACGGSMSADEYVEALNAITATGRSDFEAAATTYNQISDPTLADELAFLENEIAIRHLFLDEFAELDPPESIAEVHQILGDVFVRLTTAAENLAAIAGTLGSTEEAEQTPEFAEYGAANADGAQACLELQAELDRLSSSGEASAGVPWISSLGLVVQAALGCGEIEPG